MTELYKVKQKEWENEENRLRYCHELERGNILFFEKIPFSFPKEEIEFLLSQKQKSSKSRKNIAYKPEQGIITNHDTEDKQAAEMLLKILSAYSKRVTTFLTTLLSPYAPHWKLDYASFRPFQEKGRPARLRGRNDLLHIDAFPTRPVHGARILRFFTNINPREGRHWITSLPFAALAEKFGGEGIRFPKQMAGSAWQTVEKWLGRLFLKRGSRSPYDRFMMRLHDFMKENQLFQAECPKDHWEFPSFSCWAVFTDQVSHAALAGQYALEQTLLVPVSALLYPELSPLRILERLSGYKRLVS